MKYGQFLKPYDTIGLVAPSFGVSGYPYEPLFHASKKRFMDLGYQFKEAESLYVLDKARSNTGKKRAEEFLSMYLDEETDFLFSVAGGERMVEIIPYLDFNTLIHAKPKMYMGYSDNTCLTFLLNTLCDVASIYGSCFGSFGMKELDPSLQEAYEIITGKRLSQHSYDAYEIEDLSHIENNALCGYNKTEPVRWTTLDEKDITVRGRLIGGCLDILVHFCGTPYDQVEEFKAKYQQDGILWYLEACDLSPLGVIRALWQLKEAGWFDDCNGILFGRPKNTETPFDVTHYEAIKDTLSELNIPVIMDMDFGHLPPSFTIISGSVATVTVEDHQGSIEYELI